jgi:ADP-ribosyl-[dinitrogen reductase] hydrolase
VSKRPLPNSYWVIEGRLLAGEYPLGPQSDDHPGRIARLLAAGINCFIDLTEAGECPPYERHLPAQVQYLRKPVPDHDVPREFAHMHEIQHQIVGALRAGRSVYLHCRAGIGRTGTAIGCYLIEQGCDPNAALAELNRLWLQSERSRSWPTIPQTPEQADYIRQWVPRRAAGTGPDAAGAVDDAAALGVVQTLRERYLGTMLGLACGDALAAATQYRRPGSFTPVGDLLGGGPFDLPRGGWSDDTAMALCLAESLVEQDGFDPRDQLARFLRWQSEGHLSATGQCLGITAATARALAASRWRRQAFAGSHDPLQLDPEPLSRVAPAVLHAYGDVATVLGNAADAARLSCQAPLVLDACRLLAAMLYAALRGEPRNRILRPPPEMFGARALKPEIAAIVESGPAAPPADARSVAGGDALAVLRAVRWAFASTRSFRAGALAAVNLGGNSDVIGAVYGQLAGAHYGVAAIPRSWRAALLQAARIEALADRLLAAALVRIGTGAELP